jgi:hypothetical protein
MYQQKSIPLPRPWNSKYQTQTTSLRTGGPSVPLVQNSQKTESSLHLRRRGLGLLGLPWCFDFVRPTMFHHRQRSGGLVASVSLQRPASEKQRIRIIDHTHFVS